ncbi:MAG: putative baseplate assembly protein [Chloroflexi bacterium]|nr:putative baseplate assembly protein [Chloroflexota bacterium]
MAAGTKRIHLDAVYSAITKASWVVLSAPDWVEVFQVQAIGEETQSDYNLTLKTTRLEISGEQTEKFSPRTTNVYAQSEAIALAAQPITAPLQGATIVLDQLLPGLAAEQTLIVTGKRMRVLVLQNFALTAIDGAQRTYQTGDSLLMAQAPVTLPTGQVQWTFTDKNNFTGLITVNSGAVRAALFTVTPALADDGMVSEVAQIKTIIPNSDPTAFHLTQALANLYDRSTVFFYANVARATHGETRHEVLGSGNAAQIFQNFTLKQAPLTYVAAPTASGAQTTLQVRVNDLRWQERPSLYNLSPRDHAYITRRDDDGKTRIQFGDGVQGARLPTGDENITTTYRTGIGVAGMVKAGQLSLLMTRPLGVQKVTNPLAPTGAAEPETGDTARQNAPFTVLTLDRIVSVQDFENFARAFAGIGKTQAITLWDGERQLVYLTIAASASNGVDFTIAPTSALFQNLRQAMDAARDPIQPVTVASYKPLFFQLAARLLIDPAYMPEKVLAAATSALSQAYAFGARHFGQPVHEGEVLAIIQNVPGVNALFLEKLYFKGEPPQLQTPLPARGAIRDVDGTLKPAQLLLIDPNGIDLSVLQP